VICSVVFDLEATNDGPIRYTELQDRLDGRTHAQLAEIRAAVISIRRTKGMIVDRADPDSRSAGSFFLNPTVDDAEFAALISKLAVEDPATIPHWPTDDGRIKLTAAWLIERAGFPKGYSIGKAAISSKHAVALTNRGGATASEVAELARSIVDAVHLRLGVTLAPEVQLVGISDEMLAR
jgi:UDP-N-acetylmuramate dehydrogenase